MKTFSFPMMAGVRALVLLRARVTALLGGVAICTAVSSGVVKALCLCSIPPSLRLPPPFKFSTVKPHSYDLLGSLTVIFLNAFLEKCVRSELLHRFTPFVTFLFCDFKQDIF